MNLRNKIGKINCFEALSKQKKGVWIKTRKLSEIINLSMSSTINSCNRLYNEGIVFRRKVKDHQTYHFLHQKKDYL